MGGAQYELTKAQKVVLRAINRLSSRDRPITGTRIREECVDPRNVDYISKAAMYKALAALKEEGFVTEGEVISPGRRSRKKSYNLNFAALRESGLSHDLL